MLGGGGRSDHFDSTASCFQVLLRDSHLRKLHAESLNSNKLLALVWCFFLFFKGIINACSLYTDISRNVCFSFNEMLKFLLSYLYQYGDPSCGALLFPSADNLFY